MADVTDSTTKDLFVAALPVVSALLVPIVNALVARPAGVGDDRGDTRNRVLAASLVPFIFFGLIISLALWLTLQSRPDKASAAETTNTIETSSNQQIKGLQDELVATAARLDSLERVVTRLRQPAQPPADPAQQAGARLKGRLQTSYNVLFGYGIASSASFERWVKEADDVIAAVKAVLPRVAPPLRSRLTTALGELEQARNRLASFPNQRRAVNLGDENGNTAYQAADEIKNAVRGLMAMLH